MRTLLKPLSRRARREFGAFLRDYSWCAYAKEAAKKYKPAGPESAPADDVGEE